MARIDLVVIWVNLTSDGLSVTAVGYDVLAETATHEPLEFRYSIRQLAGGGTPTFDPAP